MAGVNMFRLQGHFMKGEIRRPNPQCECALAFCVFTRLPAITWFPGFPLIKKTESTKNF